MGHPELRVLMAGKKYCRPINQVSVVLNLFWDFESQITLTSNSNNTKIVIFCNFLEKSGKLCCQVLFMNIIKLPYNFFLQKYDFKLQNFLNFIPKLFFFNYVLPNKKDTLPKAKKHCTKTYKKSISAKCSLIF